jgi:hypothetical protein
MKVGDLVKMKGPKSQYSWRPGFTDADGIGMIVEAAHRTVRTMRGCTVLWPAKQMTTSDVPEDWLETI